jgi:hypothetical protein
VHSADGVVTFTYDAPGWADVNLDFEYGDTVSVYDSGFDDQYYGVLYLINPSTRELVFLGYPTLETGTLTLVDLSITGVQTPAVVVWPKDGSQFYPLRVVYGEDYTITEDVTSGGNRFYKVVFEDDFESNYSTYFPDAALNPKTYDVAFRARLSTDESGHASVIKAMVERAGLATKASSFTSAGSALDALCYFQIPQFDEQSVGSYRDYIQLILQSTLGVLYLDNDFEAVYELLVAPSSTDATTPSIYLRDSLRIELDYQDIVDQIIAYNPHNAIQPLKGFTESSSTTLESIKARHLHGIKNTTRFRHVLNDISGRLQAILDVRSSRRATYRFKTATKHLDAEIGDDMQLESSVLLGGDSSTDLKIVSLDKSLDDVEVEATDLQEL